MTQDEGVQDKRMLAYEPEFASVLKVTLREGNTLSTQVRQSWDTGDLRTMTKNSPATATGAHISILGHITRGELLRHLSETEAANGFANRFLWVWTSRSKILPEGGGEPDYRSLVPALHDALERARKVGKLARNDEAREAWSAVYKDLSRGVPGLFGAITARAEAQVLRLSVLYAALDGADAIKPPHLKAAQAVWEYAEQSARYIFGDAIGDPVADRLKESLAHGEMTRTQIRDIFGQHVERTHRPGSQHAPDRRTGAPGDAGYGRTPRRSLDISRIGRFCRTTESIHVGGYLERIKRLEAQSHKGDIYDNNDINDRWLPLAVGHGRSGTFPR